MKSSILALAILAGILGTSQSTKADERSGDHHNFGRQESDHHDGYDSDYHHGYDRDYYRDYSWGDPYWYHHQYGYWHHHRGYWTYRGHDHIFINVD